MSIRCTKSKREYDVTPQQSQFPQVRIVEASAGSGKTYALAKRYIQLLITPCLKPEEIPLNTILAITFTNKAAIEMKERILEFLKKIALDKFEDGKEKENFLASLHVDKEAARKKSYKIMDYLTKNYNFFQVQTIDSFINAILSGCAFRLDLSANFKTEKYYGDYLAYSMDKLIDKAGADKDVLNLFHNFLRHYLFIENKSGWFPKQDILSILKSLYSKNNRFSGRFVRNHIEVKDLISLKKYILNLMTDLTGNLPGGTDKRFLNSLSNFLERNKEGFDIDDIPDFFGRTDFPINKNHEVPDNVRKLWQRIGNSIKELCELESESAYNYYVDILNEVLRELKDITTRDDVLFLEALNKEAQRLLDEKSFLPELYCRLATRFKHFLIDEFQDTSRLQWENLLVMIEEALSTDGSLFYVGDKKQAIYRFRGGEVSLIESVKEHFPAFNLIPETLNKNYRSQREIVEFNNMVFSKENLTGFIDEVKNKKKDSLEFGDSDIKKILDIFEDSRQDYKRDETEGYVRSGFIDGKNNEEIDEIIRERILNLLEDLKERFSLKDIALLARKNNEVALLTTWLLEKDIPVESEKTLNIKENPYIKELISFLNFLNSPIDNLSFASFILGDIFLKTSGLTRQEIHDFVFRIQGKGDEEKTYLYREFRKEFLDVWESLIEEFFRSVGFVPLYELVISILSRFNVVKGFSDYQGFFMKFLEFIKEHEDEHSSISSFLEFFKKAPDEDLYVNVTEGNSVKILTIHKAKGLEFPVVIIPFLELNVKVEQEVVLSNNGNLNLIRIKKGYANFSPRLARLYREEYLKYLIDELNSIYVALTRAKDELYIFIPAKAERGANLAGALFPEKDFERGKKSEHKNPHDKEEILPIEIPPSEYKDWIPLLRDEFIEEGILKDRDKILKGEVLHHLLSFIGNLHNQDKDLVVREALEKLRFQYPSLTNLEEYAATINKLLENKSLRSYLEIRDGEVYLEKEIVDSSGNTKRIDRLIVKQGEVLIIDYKSSKENNTAYYEQMLQYMKIIREIYPDLNVRGILVYLDDLSTEEINAKDRNV